MIVKLKTAVLSLAIALFFSLIFSPGCTSEGKDEPVNDLQYALDYISGYLTVHPQAPNNEERLLVRLQRAGLTRQEAKTALEKLKYKAFFTANRAEETEELEKPVSYSSSDIERLMKGIHWGSLNYDKVRKGLANARTLLETKIVFAKAGDWFLHQDRVTVLRIESGYILSAAASRDWKYFAAAGRSGKNRGFVNLIHPASGYIWKTFQAQVSHFTSVSIPSLSISGDNKFMATAGEYELITWNLKKMNRERTWSMKYSVNTAAVSPDGKYIAANTDGKRREIYIFKRSSGKRYKKLKGYKMPIKAMVISPGNQTLATLDSGLNFILWDMSTGKKLRTIGGFSSGYQFDAGMALSADGKYLAAAAGSLLVLDPYTGKTLRKLPNGGSSGALAISGDNRYIAGTSQGKPLQVWDFKTGKLIRTIGLGSNTNPWVSLSPDGNYMAAVCGSNTIQVWALHRFPTAEECYRRAGMESTGQLRIAEYCSQKGDYKTAAVYYEKAGEHTRAEECRRQGNK